MNNDALTTNYQQMQKQMCCEECDIMQTTTKRSFEKWNSFKSYRKWHLRTLRFWTAFSTFEQLFQPDNQDKLADNISTSQSFFQLLHVFCLSQEKIMGPYKKRQIRKPATSLQTSIYYEWVGMLFWFRFFSFNLCVTQVWIHHFVFIQRVACSHSKNVVKFQKLFGTKNISQENASIHWGISKNFLNIESK